MIVKIYEKGDTVTMDWDTHYIGIFRDQWACPFMIYDQFINDFILCQTADE